MRANKGQPGVIYIGGYGRSGSTLLDILLGMHPNIESAGEIVHFLNEMEKQASRCSCGQSTRNCLHWKKCFDDVAGVLFESKLSLKEAQRIQGQYESRMRFAPRVMGCGMVGSRARHYRKVQRSVLSSIVKDDLDVRYVVDSSKTASSMGSRPFALQAVADCSVHFIHLVRSPQSLIGSLMRGSNKDLEKGDVDVRRYRVVKGLLGWVQANLFGVLAGRVMGEERYILVRYEDLLHQPDKTFGRIADFLDVNPAPWRPVIDRQPVERVWHIFAGNRMRHSSVTLKKHGLQEEIPPAYRSMCLALCWPLMRQFGY